MKLQDKLKTDQPLPPSSSPLPVPILSDVHTNLPPSEQTSDLILFSVQRRRPPYRLFTNTTLCWTPVMSYFEKSSLRPLKSLDRSVPTPKNIGITSVLTLPFQVYIIFTPSHLSQSFSSNSSSVVNVVPYRFRCRISRSTFPADRET